AEFALNTANLPTPANGWAYMLSTQPDPTLGMSDLVVSYAPAPEPSALMLLAPAAGAMLLRRRRKAGLAEAAA
ncbi:MAG TPA: PEP-CTERM sorting domain-containing protein, partial [Tepidisphaeraceae bacterium]